EDGIRDFHVTGVQTCALPISKRNIKEPHPLAGLLRCGECGCRVTPETKRKGGKVYPYLRCANGKKQHEKLTYVPESTILTELAKIGRASCRERVWNRG